MKFFKNVSKKEFLILFFIIIVPNMLRQVIYYAAFLKTNSIDFIDSFETRLIYGSFPFIGIFEEIIIAIVFLFLWFNFKRLRFLSYGWVNDALFDFMSVLSWFIYGLTPLQFLGFGIIPRFFIRELILPYIILGPLMYRAKFDIKKLSVLYGFIGLAVLFMIIFR